MCIRDRIIVVALGDAGHILSETHDGHIAPQQFLHFVLVFLPLWWIWAGHTIYANRFDTDSRQHRLSTLLIMFLLIVISAQLSAGAQDHYDYALAVACYCGARLIVAAMYFVSKRKHHDRVASRRRWAPCSLSARRSAFPRSCWRRPGATWSSMPGSCSTWPPWCC